MLRLATKFAVQPSALETAYQAGFRHAEVWLDRSVLDDWRTILAQASSYPNGYALHFPNQLNIAEETLQNAVNLYRALGSRCLIIHQPMYDKFREPLLRLDPELQFAVENHVLTPEGFEAWAEKNIGLTLDVEHLWKFTLRDAPLEKLLERVRSFLNQHGSKLRHVHLPGYWPGFPEHRPMYCSREMILGVFSLLSEASFEGLVVSEVDPEYQNPHELRMDVLLFDAWRGRCQRFI